MAKINIGVLTGSLRKESYSKKIGLYVAGLLPEDFTANMDRFERSYPLQSGL
jgi:NAD(P)H-dependent FMN reductase